MSSKMIKSFLIGLGGAVATYALAWTSGHDFGQFTPLVTAVLAVGVNYLKELAQNQADN